MFIYDDQYEAEVNKKWHRFIGGGESLPQEDAVVRPEIWDSWRRSVALDISPIEVKDLVLSQDELSSIRQTNKLLMDVSHPYIQNIYSFVRGTNFVLALTDAQGYVLDLVGDDTNIRQRTKKAVCVRAAIVMKVMPAPTVSAYVLNWHAPFKYGEANIIFFPTTVTYVPPHQ